MTRRPVEGLAGFIELVAGLGLHLDPTLQDIAPVRALAHVIWEPGECGTEVRSLFQLEEGHGHFTDFGHSNLGVVGLNRDWYVFPFDGSHVMPPVLVRLVWNPSQSQDSKVADAECP